MTSARHPHAPNAKLIALAAAGWLGFIAAAFAQGAPVASAPPDAPASPAPVSPYKPRGVGQHVVVIELYTSQGCSSCPPADQLLTDLTGREDVLPLTLPITYWDKLGWADTLARPVNTHRQMAYAERTKKGRVYTPQMIIDGYFHAIGSRRADVLEKIAKRHRAMVEASGAPVPVSISVNGGTVTVGIEARPDALRAADKTSATVWLFPFTRMEMVHIGGGENRGRSIRYSHVVRNIVEMGTWTGGDEELTRELNGHDADAFAYAAVVQADKVGPVLGAAWVALETPAPPAMAPMAEPAIGASPIYVTLPN